MEQSTLGTWQLECFTQDAGETNQGGDSQSQWREKTGRKTELNTTGSTDKKEVNMEKTPEHKTWLPPAFLYCSGNIWFTSGEVLYQEAKQMWEESEKENNKWAEKTVSVKWSVHMLLCNCSHFSAPSDDPGTPGSPPPRWPEGESDRQTCGNRTALDNESVMTGLMFGGSGQQDDNAEFFFSEHLLLPVQCRTRASGADR